MEKNKKRGRNTQIMDVHLGNLLSEKIKEKRLSKKAVERSIGRSNNAVKRLMGRPSIQAYLLWELSIALEYDFFAEISRALQQKHQVVGGANGNDKTLIASLEKELADVKRERDNLIKMLNLLSK